VAATAEWREYKLIYKRYASLFFITCGVRAERLSCPAAAAARIVCARETTVQRAL